MKLSTVGTFFVLVRVYACAHAHMQCVRGRESGRVSES